MGRVTAHRMANDQAFIGKLITYGFKKVTFKDGYSTSYSYMLKPIPDSELAITTLKKQALDKPMILE